MPDKNPMELLREASASIRLVPALFSAFLAGLLLLFYRELFENVKLFLIPSLVVYSLGAALIGTFHRIIAFYYQAKKGVEKPISNEFYIPWLGRISIWGIHLILFVAFIIYNFRRGSL